MKRILTAVAALAFVATAVVPAFADGDDHGRNNRDWQRDHYQQQYRDRDGDYRRDAYQAQARREWREGDYWQGHRVIYRNGAWGYLAPASGFFIRINL